MGHVLGDIGQAAGSGGGRAAGWCFSGRLRFGRSVSAVLLACLGAAGFASATVSAPALAQEVVSAVKSPGKGSVAAKASPGLRSRLGEGLAALEASDYAIAREALTASAQGPEGWKAKLALAEMHLLLGAWDEAIRGAVDAAAASPQARCPATIVQARALASKGDLDNAIAKLRSVASASQARECTLWLGELLVQAGRSQEAQGSLHALIQMYNNDTIGEKDASGLALVGRAAYLLRSPADANDAYNQSERAGQADAQTLLWRAELFLDKDDIGLASEVLEQLLRKAPNHPQALALAARVKLDWQFAFSEATKLVDRALRVAPNHPKALFVKASIALRDYDISQADAILDRGLAHSPGDLELLSLRAAARFLQADGPGLARVRDQVLQRRRNYSEMYQIIGQFADWEHRYEELATMMKQAVQVNPDDAKAWAVLGHNLIRLGLETEGISALKSSWQLDTYDVRVYNTLNLFEQSIPEQYVSVTKGPLRYRFPNDQRHVLERYVPQTLSEAYESMIQRYGFRPIEPVGIELYKEESHFAVRTSGQPTIGIQGVCFGRTLASLSPQAAPFNWAMVLWHELAHVFAIQMSKSRVPRWFTEGLSEYETIRRYPDWQRHHDITVYHALQRGALPKVERFNQAFTHANSDEDMTLAYYTSSQMVMMIAEQFGMRAITRMLRLWGQNLRDNQVIQTALGLSPSDLDKRFDAWLRLRLHRYAGQFVPDLQTESPEQEERRSAKNPGDRDQRARWALALLRDGQDKRAQAQVSELLAAEPSHGLATYVQGLIYARKKQWKRAHETFERMLGAGVDGYTVRVGLAETAQMMKQPQVARQHWLAARRWDPSQTQPLDALRVLAAKTGKTDPHSSGERLAVLRDLSLLEPHNKALAMHLLELLVKEKAWDEAAQVASRAVFTDLHNPKVHLLYATALRNIRRFSEAEYELATAKLCKPGAPLKAQIEQEQQELESQRLQQGRGGLR